MSCVGCLKVVEGRFVVPGECVLTTNMAVWDQQQEEVEEEEDEVRGSLVVFIIASVLLVLGLVGVAVLVQRSRSKSASSQVRPGGYEKLGGDGRHGGHASAPYSSASRFQEDQLVDIGIREDEDDGDDDEDEDIVYMGRDGTVYRRFRYGQLGEDKEDELEYDDESYAFR